MTEKRAEKIPENQIARAIQPDPLPLNQAQTAIKQLERLSPIVQNSKKLAAVLAPANPGALQNQHNTGNKTLRVGGYLR